MGVTVPVIKQVEVQGQTTVQQFGGGASIIGTNVVTGSYGGSVGVVPAAVGAGSSFTHGATSGTVLGGGISAVQGTSAYSSAESRALGGSFASGTVPTTTYGSAYGNTTRAF